MEGQSFFSTLKDFCCSFEKELQESKKAFSEPHGTKPETYYKGLDLLRNEFNDVKKMHSDMREKCDELPDLESYLSGLKSRFSEVEKRILNIQDHFIKYGYDPPQSNTEEENLKEDQIDDTNPEKSCAKLKAQEPHMLISPELSYFSTRHLQTSNALQSTLLTTPVSQKHPETSYSITPMSTNRKKMVQNWLSTVRPLEEESTDVETTTPYVPPTLKDLNEGKMPLANKGIIQTRTSIPPDRKSSNYDWNFIDCHGNSLSAKNSLDPEADDCQKPEPSQFKSIKQQLENSSHTPEEPTLSSFSSSYKIKKEPRTFTPEEPVLSTFSQTKLLQSDKRSCTPEEPALSSFSTNLKGTLEEPILTSFLNVRANPSEGGDFQKEERLTPVEPQLSLFSNDLSNHSKPQDASLAESPNLSSLPSTKIHDTLKLSEPLEMQVETTDIFLSPEKVSIKNSPDSSNLEKKRLSDFCLKSPELSDITMKLCNLKPLQSLKVEPILVSKPKPKPKYVSPLKENIRKVDELPASPMLSETTIKNMNLKQFK